MNNMLTNSTENNINLILDIVTRTVMKVIDNDTNDTLKLMDKSLLEKSIVDISLNRIKDNIKI